MVKTELNREHFRAIIYYNFQRQLSQQECLGELLSVFGNEAPHHVSDDSRVGAPKTAVTQENVDAMRKLMIEDRHVTYREIEASLRISKTSIQKILHEELEVRKLVSRLIPHLLTEEQEAARVNSGRMVATFVSKAGHIATIPLEQRIVTADWYTTICLPKVITELQKINPERRIILHQVNASSHTAQKSKRKKTPNDFFTFPKIKKRLRGQRFQSPEEAVDAFKNAMCINIRGEYFEKQ
ncbi:unnamed protein product [Acanthoscelides obtectus]|uniref:Uncharacterized protein n=1 Tax=Acanthoscelides obtectus TaxID=200917 RepID=A0A9P0LXZ0_ACAOB|nr:unnamed protein product [Acanthoscelides obtectus]CAK1629214.1 hypothetical protein AOBTE_LOCUS5625 [Acanthoscelides obtectus]